MFFKKVNKSQSVYLVSLNIVTNISSTRITKGIYLHDDIAGKLPNVDQIYFNHESMHVYANIFGFRS